MSTEKVNVSGNEENVNAENNQSTPKTYSEAEFKGLLADKQSEVRKRQELEQQIAGLKADRAEGTGKPDTGADSERTDTGVADSDKPLTVAEFKKLLADERKAEAEKVFTNLDADSVAEAKAKYTAESAGEGLDYDSVVAEGLSNLTEGDKLAIRQSKNPAYERYRRCIFNTPELSEKAEAFRASKLLENVKFKGRVPASGSAETRASASDDISAMSEDELDKLAAELA